MITASIRFIKQNAQQPFGRVVLGAVSFLLVLSLTFTILQTVVGYSKFKLGWDNIRDSELEKLEYFDSGLYHIVKYVNRYVPRDARILTFRQSDLGYYTKNPIAVQFDPEYISLFNDTLSEAEVAVFLSSKDIHYVHVPHYIEPAIFSSNFGSFLSDPQHVQLLTFYGGARLYRVFAPGEINEISFTKLYSTGFGEGSFGPAAWTFFRDGRFYDREFNSTVKLTSNGEAVLELASNQSLNPKRSTRVLTMGAGRFEKGLGSNAIPVRPASELRLCLTQAGAGYFSFFIHEYGNSGLYLGRSSAWNAAANSAAAETCFLVRSSAHAYNLRLELRVPEFSAIQLHRLTVEEVNRAAPSPEEHKAKFLSSGWLVMDEDFRTDSTGLDWSINSDPLDSITLRSRSSSSVFLSAPVTEVPALPNRMSADVTGLGEVMFSADWICGDSSFGWQTTSPLTTLTGTEQTLEWTASAHGLSVHPDFESLLGKYLRLTDEFFCRIFPPSQAELERNKIRQALWVPNSRERCRSEGTIRGHISIKLDSSSELDSYTDGISEVTVGSVTLHFEDGASIVLSHVDSKLDL